MKYVKLVSVDLLHDFFSDGNETSALFKPVPQCEKQLRLNRQFFRVGGNGFSIMADSDKIGKEPEDKVYYFDIAVYISDPYFSTYSNLDIDYKAGRVYYAGNADNMENVENTENTETTGEGEDNGSKEAKQLTLTNLQPKTEYEGIVVQLQPRQFSVSIEAGPGDLFKLLDKSGQAIKKWEFEKEAAGLYVDIGRRPPGMFTLEKNGVAVGYYYADDLLCKEKPAFIISIRLALKDVNVAGSILPAQFEARIANRPVYWRYNVFARSYSRKLSSLSITNNNTKSISGIAFSRERMDEEKGQAVFVSDRPIPLIEGAYKDIEIEVNSGGTPLIEHLPNAAVSSVGFKEGRWISDLFVYV